jgi:hypothetical protein
LYFEYKKHKAQLEDQKPKKNLRRSSRRRKTAKPINDVKSGKPHKTQKKLKLKTLPNTLNASSTR